MFATPSLLVDEAEGWLAHLGLPVATQRCGLVEVSRASQSQDEENVPLQASHKRLQLCARRSVCTPELTIRNMMSYDDIN